VRKATQIYRDQARRTSGDARPPTYRARRSARIWRPRGAWCAASTSTKELCDLRGARGGATRSVTHLLQQLAGRGRGKAPRRAVSPLARPSIFHRPGRPSAAWFGDRRPVRGASSFHLSARWRIARARVTNVAEELTRLLTCPTAKARDDPVEHADLPRFAADHGPEAIEIGRSRFSIARRRFLPLACSGFPRAARCKRTARWCA
jgi:hypothetical protein